MNRKSRSRVALLCLFATFYLTVAYCVLCKVFILVNYSFSFPTYIASSMALSDHDDVDNALDPALRSIDPSFYEGGNTARGGLEARPYRSSSPEPPKALDSYLELECPDPEFLPPNASLTALRLAKMPIVRGLELRPKKTLRGLELGKANLEASLGQVRGHPPVSGFCSRCVFGRCWMKGPFAECIVVPGFFAGACCNCRYNRDGSGCDFHCRYPDSLLHDCADCRSYVYESSSNRERLSSKRQ